MTFLRWMGGKREVLHQFKHMFPDINNCKGYIEPFIGGGSVFYYIRENYNLDNKPIFISDINKELIVTYKVVRDKLNELIPLLEKHQKLNNKEYYIKMKKIFPPGDGMTDIEKAGAFIYLSKSTFGSQWGVNSKGKLVSSYRGNEGENIFDKDTLTWCSKLLKGTFINNYSFEKILDINKGNLKDYFVYCCLPGTKIRMRDESLLNIEDIKIGNKTFMGESVINTISRNYIGDIYEFEITGIYDNLCVTEEHPLAVIRQERVYEYKNKHMSKFKHQQMLDLLNPQFIKSKDIRIGDFLLVPCYPENVSNIKTVKIGEIDVKCDEDFGWICGFWLAEGHINHWHNKIDYNIKRAVEIKKGNQTTLFDLKSRDIDILINDGEYDSSKIIVYSCGDLDFELGFVDRLDKWYSHYFGITGDVKKLPWRCSQIYYRIEELAKYLYENFGKHAENKNVSNKLLNYPLEFQKGLLCGWLDGDGGICGDANNRCKVTGTSVSKQLASDMYLISLRLGLRPLLKQRGKEGKQTIIGIEYNANIKWDTYFASQEDVKYLYPDCHDFGNSITRSQRRIITKGNKKFILTPITDILKKEYRGNVYNLETERHVYIANYVLSHNCDPPYYNVNVKNYAKDGFCLDTKTKIPFVFRELDKKGAKVMLSNADCPIMYEYFKDYNINVIKTNRSKVQLDKVTKEKMANEDDVNEVVVTNYKMKKITIDNAWGVS